MPSRTKVVVFAQDPNPYLRLLYDAMHRVDPTLRVHYVRRYPVAGAVTFPVAAVYWRLRGYRVLHVHWPKFTFELRGPRARVASLRLFRFCIWLVARLRYRVVWTAHNAVPHVPETSDDVFTSRRMAELADVTIAHSQAAITQLAELGCDVTRAVVVPHGNYAGVYPDGVGRDEARRELGVGASEFVVLFFGNVKPYKGVGDLLRAAAAADLPDTRLLIVGAGAPPELRAQIDSSPMPTTHVDRRVRDDEVAAFFRAADVVCLPFTSVTTSGSALLALTFGHALITPARGGLAELPPDVGWLYDPDDAGALAASLAVAHADRAELARRATAAAAYADSVSWDDIARRTRTLYDD